YFREWVHHYRQLFELWTQSVLSAGTNLPSSSKGGYRPRELWERLKNCQDPLLKNQFARAKDTFFRSDSTMRLNVPPEYLDRILTIRDSQPPNDEQELTNKMPSFPKQPEPSIFDPILRIVQDALDTSFARFIKLAFCNAGLWHCVPGACGGTLIAAGGLAMWAIGLTSHRRGYVAGSLPLVWIGLWFMLVTLSGHCLTVYVTGDARQLYPWEMARPLPPDVIPPPVYSLAPAPAPDGVTLTPASSFNRYLGYSSLARLSLPIHRPRHQTRTSAGRRWSEDTLKMFAQRKDDDDRSIHPDLDRKSEPQPLKPLPPARKTKDLARTWLAMDAEQANIPGESGYALVHMPSPGDSATDLSQRRGAVVDLSVTGFGSQGRPDSPFSEEHDFGIVISEEYEEDELPEMHHFSRPVQPYPTSDLSYDEGLATQRPSCSTWVLDAPRQPPIASLIQPPERVVQRRRTMPDLLEPLAASVRRGSDALTIDLTTRRGSRSSETEQGHELYWPWARKLYGPMTLVHSPLVRRAHWATTWRAAAISTFVAFGLTLGLIR
ncbi:unnamed protein product, partial [Rhizoctonia solani]